MTENPMFAGSGPSPKQEMPNDSDVRSTRVGPLSQRPCLVKVEFSSPELRYGTYAILTSLNPYNHYNHLQSGGPCCTSSHRVNTDSPPFDDSNVHLGLGN